VASTQSKRTGTCVYCQRHTAALEDEHVFPDSWYPTTTPTGTPRIKVPSCPECNREFGRVEERLQRVWAMCIDVADPASKGVYERVSRSLSARHGRNAKDARIRAGTRRKMIQSIAHRPIAARGVFPGFESRGGVWVQQPSGLVALSSRAIPIAASDVEAFTKKLVLGLHFHVSGNPLPENCEVRTYLAKPKSSPLEVAICSRDPEGVSPGFLYWRGEATDGTIALWFFKIWGQIRLQASTHLRA